MNKKKVLSLALATVMTVGGVSTSNAAVTHYICKDGSGVTYEYSYNDLVQSYQNKLLKKAIGLALYEDYAKKDVFALRDNKKGYVDFNKVLEGYQKFILKKGDWKDVDTFTETSGTAIDVGNPPRVVTTTTQGTLLIEVPQEGISSASAVNGTITITMLKDIVENPIFNIKLGNTSITPSSVTYSKNIATISVPLIEATTSEQAISYSISYKGGAPILASPFIVEEVMTVNFISLDSKTIEVTYSKEVASASKYTLVSEGVTLADKVDGVLQTDKKKVRFSVASGQIIENNRTYTVTADDIKIPQTFKASIAELAVSVLPLNKRQVDVKFTRDIKRTDGENLLINENNLSIWTVAEGYATSFNPVSAVLLKDGKTIRLTFNNDLTDADYFLRINGVSIQSIDGTLIPEALTRQFKSNINADINAPELVYAVYNNITGKLLLEFDEPTFDLDLAKISFGDVVIDGKISKLGKTSYVITLTAEKSLDIKNSTVLIKANTLKDINSIQNLAKADITFNAKESTNEYGVSTGDLTLTNAVFQDFSTENKGYVGEGDLVLLTFSNKLSTELPSTDDFLLTDLSLGINATYTKLNDRQVLVKLGENPSMKLDGTSKINAQDGSTNFKDIEGNVLASSSSSVNVEKFDNNAPYIISAEWLDINQDSKVDEDEFLDLKFNKPVKLFGSSITNSNFIISSSGNLGGTTDAILTDPDVVRLTLSGTPVFVANTSTIDIIAGTEPNITDAYDNPSSTKTPVVIKRILDTTQPTFKSVVVAGTDYVKVEFNKVVMKNDLNAFYSSDKTSSSDLSNTKFIEMQINGTTTSDLVIERFDNKNIIVTLSSSAISLLKNKNFVQATDVIKLSFLSDKVYDMSGNALQGSQQVIPITSSQPLPNKLFADASSQKFFIDASAPIGLYTIYVNNKLAKTYFKANTIAPVSAPVYLKAGDIVAYTFTDTANKALESLKTADGIIPSLTIDGISGSTSLTDVTKWSWNASKNTLTQKTGKDVSNINLVIVNGGSTVITGQSTKNITTGLESSTPTALSVGTLSAGSLGIAIYNDNGNVSSSLSLGSILQAPNSSDLNSLSIISGANGVDYQASALGNLSQSNVSVVVSINGGEFDTVIGQTSSNGVFTAIPNAISNSIYTPTDEVTFAYRDSKGNIGK